MRARPSGTFRAALTFMFSHARILVADDDPELLKTVAEAFERAGAEVARADSGVELITQMANEGPFGLIVTDISMPWLSGLQALQSARTAGLPTAVIVMTALKDERIPAQVAALGDHAVLLRKPFDLGALEAAATRVLSGGEAPRR